MLVLGITGGICTGKSLAAAVIEQRGARVIDCDEISRYLAKYDPRVLAAIRAGFGDQVFHPLGALNRQALGALVMQDPARRQALEAILHPAISAVVDANIAAAQSVPVPCVVVAPLLIEAGMAGQVYRIWVVSCSAETQRARLMQRSKVSVEQAQRWIDAQLSLPEKEKHASLVLRNDGTVDELEQAVAKAWDEFLVEAGFNA